MGSWVNLSSSMSCDSKLDVLARSLFCCPDEGVLTKLDRYSCEVNRCSRDPSNGDLGVVGGDAKGDKTVEVESEYVDSEGMVEISLL